MGNLNFEELLAIAEDYADLGYAVQEQVRVVLHDGESAEDQNPNALRMIRQWLRSCRGFNDDLDAEIEDAIALLTPDAE